jgi:hypothetical protein
MPLPSQAVPTYTLTIPSSGEDLKFRPFLVKEQKALLIAQQSDDALIMIDTLKSVVQACALKELDVSNMAIFDLEYVFSQIRAKSVGETVDLFFFCDTCEDEKAKVKITIDLTKLQVTKDPTHISKIELFEDVGIVMKYPGIDIINKVDNIDYNQVDIVFEIIVNCIDHIYNSQEVFYAKEQTKEELETFLNNLTQDQFHKVQSFFETMPKLKHKVNFNCPVCSKPHERVMEGLSNFF